MKHELKINRSIADEIVNGNRTFDVRSNIAEEFQKGDEVAYIATDRIGTMVIHGINKKAYRVSYVFSGSGVDRGYVVIGLAEGTFDNVDPVV